MPKGFNDFRASRDRCVWRLFRDMVKSLHGPISVRILAHKIASSPAPRLWISEERALRLMHDTLAGRPVRLKVPTRMAQYRELVSRVRRAMAADPGTALKELVFRAVNSPAPSFYLSPEYIRVMLYRMVRNSTI